MYEVLVEIELKKQGMSPLDFLNSLKEWLTKQLKEGKIGGYLIGDTCKLEGDITILQNEVEGSDLENIEKET